MGDKALLVDRVSEDMDNMALVDMASRVDKVLVDGLTTIDNQHLFIAVSVRQSFVPLLFFSIDKKIYVLLVHSNIKHSRQ